MRIIKIDIAHTSRKWVKTAEWQLYCVPVTTVKYQTLPIPACHERCQNPQLLPLIYPYTPISHAFQCAGSEQQQQEIIFCLIQMTENIINYIKHNYFPMVIDWQQILHISLQPSLLCVLAVLTVLSLVPFGDGAGVSHSLFQLLVIGHSHTMLTIIQVQANLWLPNTGTATTQILLCVLWESKSQATSLPDWRLCYQWIGLSTGGFTSWMFPTVIWNISSTMRQSIRQSTVQFVCALAATEIHNSETLLQQIFQQFG